MHQRNNFFGYNKRIGKDFPARERNIFDWRKFIMNKNNVKEILKMHSYKAVNKKL